jgi:biotin operon repressor
MNSIVFTRSTASTDDTTSVTRDVSTSSGIVSYSSQDHRSSNADHSVAQNVDIESAVYAHIQAIRALGVTRTNSLRIANALGIPQRVVERTISSLTNKGVKVINE